MITKLEDTQVVMSVLDAISTDSDQSFEDYVKSLSLPGDEEAAITESVQTLPDVDTDPASLPVKPPSVMSHAWWH